MNTELYVKPRNTKIDRRVRRAQEKRSWQSDLRKEEGL